MRAIQGKKTTVVPLSVGRKEIIKYDNGILKTNLYLTNMMKLKSFLRIALITFCLCAAANAARGQCISGVEPEEICLFNSETTISLACANLSEGDVLAVRLVSEEETIEAASFEFDESSQEIAARFPLRDPHAGVAFDVEVETASAGTLILEAGAYGSEGPEISGETFLCPGQTDAEIAVLGTCTSFGIFGGESINSVTLRMSGEDDVVFLKGEAEINAESDELLTVSAVDVSPDMTPGAWDVVVDSEDQGLLVAEGAVTVVGEPQITAFGFLCPGQPGVVVLSGRCFSFGTMQDPVIEEVRLFMGQQTLFATNIMETGEAANIFVEAETDAAPGEYVVEVRTTDGQTIIADGSVVLQEPGVEATAFVCPGKPVEVDIWALCASLGGEGLNNIGSATLTNGEEMIEAEETSVGELGVSATATFPALSAEQLESFWNLELELTTRENYVAENVLFPACETSSGDPCEDNPMMIELEIQDATLANDGSITVNVMGGNPPLEYSIDGGGNYQPENVFSPLAAGVYTIYVRDAEGCTEFVEDEVELISSVAEQRALSNSLRVYPNPATDELSVSFSAPQNAEGRLLVRDLAGRAVATQRVSWTSGGNVVALESVETLADGVYFLQVFVGEVSHTVKVVKQ